MNTAAKDNDELQDVDAAAPEAEPKEEPKQRLELQVTVNNTSSCERHVTVVIPRVDIDRYFEMEFDELAPKAEVPGFRPGKAPRKLVVSRFKEHISDQVKGKLLMDSLAQINEDHNFSAISEPDMKLDAVVLPDEGDMTFEFNLEVRPEFEMPEWKGLSLRQPRHDITDSDIDAHLQRLLKRYGKLADHHEPVEDGDYVTLNLTFSRDGNELSKVQEQTVVVKPKLSFRDAQLDNFADVIRGAKAGDRREATVKISDDVDNEALKGQEVRAEFEVVKVEKLQLPKLTSAFLSEVGGFTDEADLRSAVREELERQVKFRQQQAVRQQITSQLTSGANWALPPALLRKQTKREMQRMVLELQSAGFSNDVIQAHANELSRRSLAYTETALKEHFILERLAEDHEIEAETDDYSREIELIAEQSGIPARRVRARLEKQGEMDSLRNQIIERKVIELITSHALVEEVPYEAPTDDVIAIDHVISGVEERETIPEAHHGEEPKSLPGTPTHSG